MIDLKSTISLVASAAAILSLGAAQPITAANEPPSEATRLLLARNAEFNQAVIEVAPGVFVADGYGVSPITMVVGKDGYFLIDAGVDPGQSRLARSEFEKRTSLPLKAIIFTHGHNDHVSGAPAFVAPGGPLDVWAARNFGSEDRWQEGAGLTIQNLRGLRQSGMTLPDSKRINNGVAKAFRAERRPGQQKPANQVLPNRFVDDRIMTEIAGIKVEMFRSNGETDDAIAIWLPDQQVMFAGDTFYKSWPNAYAIRGTGYRDVLAWAKSIDAMRAKHPAVLVGGHTKPIIGADQVDSVLGNYSRAIHYIFDQTIAGMNAGKSPDELASTIKLPEDLANLDYLRSYYGNPQWAIRSIYTAYLGWFDGNPTNLFRLPPQEEAKRIVALAGGEAKIRSAIEKAMRNRDWQWAVELIDRLLALHPNDLKLRHKKADVLDMMADGLLTATGRNYYLTYAQELRANRSDPPRQQPTR